MLIEVKPPEKTFSHGGDTGDLIYALPTVKMLGGGRLRLVKAQQVREPFSPAKVESLRPLLEAQPYISGVEYGEDCDRPQPGRVPEALPGRFESQRSGVEHLRRTPLPAGGAVAVLLGTQPGGPGCHQPVAALPRQPLPLASGPGEVRHEAVFVGLPEEHAAWQDEFGPVRYYPTPDWWELCRVIAGSQIFCGNQSAPMAIALGLCVPRIVQEVCLNTPNCHFERRGVVYGRDENVELPD